MTRLPKLLFAILVLTASVAAAQVAPPPPGNPLVAYLGLSAEQKTAWQTAHQEFADTTRPLVENQRALESELRTATENCAIGTLVLQIRAIGDQLRAAHEALEQKLVAVLTPEQKVKYDAFKAAVEFLRHQPQGPGPGPR